MTRNTLHSGWSHVLSFLWPERCAGCAAEVQSGVPFCGICRLSLVSIGSSCPGCALPWPHSALRCPGCRARPLPFTQAYAAWGYGGAMKEAVLRMKHGPHRYLTRSLAFSLAPTFAAAVAPGDLDLVIPVPLHPSRLRQRGFNQAQDLVQGLPRPPATRLVVNGLRRVRDTPALGHRSRAERQETVRGAFRVTEATLVRNRRCLLIDDVMTTGATLSACSVALWEAGAAEVRVLALARAL